MYKLYQISLSVLFFTKIDFNKLNILNLFLNNLNSIKLNIFFLVIIIYCNYFNSSSYKFYYIVSVLYYSIYSKYGFILYNFTLGYYKIHPPLLYFSLIIFIVYIYKVKFFCKIYFNFVCYTIFLTFMLGSLWSISQSVWGRYWSNDSIEIILLLFFIISLYYTHILYNINNSYKLFFILQIIFLLSLLRLNFIFTKHNFFQKIIKNHNFFYLLYTFIIINIYKYIYNNKKKLNITILKLFFYYLIIQITLNLVNIYLFKIFNTWLIFTYLFYLITLNIIIKKFLFIHLFLFINLLTFNNYFINFFKYNILCLYQKKNLNIYYFIYQKNINFYLYYKNIYKNFNFKFHKFYINLKESFVYLKKKSTQVYMINFF